MASDGHARPVAPLPAARPARRRAVPAHAAARAADRDPQHGRARRLRRALPPPLGAPGALGHAVPERRPRTTSCARSALAGAARRRSSTARAACSSRNVAGQLGADLAGRPARRRAARACSSACSTGRRRPGRGDRAARSRSAKNDPLDAGDVKRGDPPRPGRLPRRARDASSPACRSPRRYAAPLPVQGARGAGARLRRRDRRTSSSRRLKAEGYAPATRSARTASRRRTTSTCAAAPGIAELRVDSLGPAARRPHPDAVAPAPGNAIRLTIDVEAPAGGRARAALRDRARARRTSSGRERRRDRRARPARRRRCSRWRRTRPTSRASTSAASTRRSSRRC